MPLVTMESLSDAILLNNTGIHHLEHSDVDDALYSFQCAVAAVKIAIARTTSDPTASENLKDQSLPTTTIATTERFPPNAHDGCLGHHDGISSSSSSSSICGAIKSSGGTDTAGMLTSVSTTDSVLPQQQHSNYAFLDGLNTGISYIYNRPLLIPSDITFQSMEHMNSVVVTASIYIIFNFALACHGVGKHTGKESYLIRAMRLYELTLKVLDSTHSNGSSAYAHEMHSVLECLAFNNLAQLHNEYCNYQASQYYLDSMYAILKTINHLDAYLEENELEEIMLNLVYLKSPTVAKAA